MSDVKIPFQEALTQIENVIKYKKCWKCGCNQGAVRGLERELGKFTPEDRATIEPLLEEAKSLFQPIEYDCLRCKICFPGDLSNALAKAYPSLELEPDSCVSDDIFVDERNGFPPFPGNYQVMRYQAPVAVCTLNSKDLIRELADTQHPALSIVGSLNTENLGIERIIRNTMANPNIRYLIVCGEDSEQRIGHLPGQSLVSLGKSGIDAQKRIIGAEGKRPILKNLEPSEVDSFRAQVEVLDFIGISASGKIMDLAESCRARGKKAFHGAKTMTSTIQPIAAKPPKSLALDPSGYFVIFPDGDKQKISVEHYHNNGTLNQIIEGADISSIYMTIIDLGLVSKLDHASYLGKELARAEESLRTGTPYQQDKAQDSPEEPEKKCGGTGCC